MTETLSAPLVPADIDVDGLDSFMLNVDRLMTSELWALSTGDEFKAALALWCRAWKQRPAGSLPNDEKVLAAFSCAGAKWKRVRAMALRGFVECADGRLYHKTLCEDVLRAAEKKVERRGRTAAATEARQRLREEQRRRDEPRNGLRDVERNVEQNVNVTESHRRDGTVQGREEEPIAKAIGRDAPVGGGDPGRPDWWPTQDRYGRITSEVTEKIMFDVGKAVLGKSSGGQISKLRKAYRDMRAVTDLLLQAEEKSDAGEWIAGVIRKAENGEPVDPKHELYPDAIYTDGEKK